MHTCTHRGKNYFHAGLDFVIFQLAFSNQIRLVLGELKKGGAARAVDLVGAWLNVKKTAQLLGLKMEAMHSLF